MPELDSPDYWPSRRKKVAAALEEKGWTRKELARAANVAPKTVSNFLSGDHCSWATFKSLCKALDVSTAVDEKPVQAVQDVAKPELGGYTREAYADYLGGYFAYRRSFISRDRVLRSIYTLEWSKEVGGLAFKEYQQYKSRGKSVDHSQNGPVHISPKYNLVHLVTSAKGAVRLVTLIKNEDLFRGAILTQSDQEQFYQPSISPIYLEKIQNFDPSAPPLELVGPIDRAQEDFAPIAERLEEIERKTILFASNRAGEPRAPRAAAKRKSRGARRAANGIQARR
jgi:transcriptional regulator with XRE-family HTH domain